MDTCTRNGVLVLVIYVLLEYELIIALKARLVRLNFIAVDGRTTGKHLTVAWCQTVNSKAALFANENNKTLMRSQPCA